MGATVSIANLFFFLDFTIIVVAWEDNRKLIIWIEIIGYAIFLICTTLHSCGIFKMGEDCVQDFFARKNQQDQSSQELNIQLTLLNILTTFGTIFYVAVRS